MFLGKFGRTGKIVLFYLFFIIVGSIMVEQAETKAGWIVLIVAGGVYAAIGWIFF